MAPLAFQYSYTVNRNNIDRFGARANYVVEAQRPVTNGKVSVAAP